MAKRTQIVCMHEGRKGPSIDPVFANEFLKAYDPEWLRPGETGKARFVACGGKSELLKAFPNELSWCDSRGGDTTLIVFADVDDVLGNGDQLKQKYWDAARTAGIAREIFDQVVFIFPKDRIENWIEFLLTGNTNENREGPRVFPAKAKEAAKLLAKKCRSRAGPQEAFPPSLEWSCRNWRALIERIHASARF